MRVTFFFNLSHEVVRSSLLFFFQDSGTSSVKASLRNAKNEDYMHSKGKM